MKNSLTTYFSAARRNVDLYRSSTTYNLVLVMLCGVFLVGGCSSIGKSIAGGGDPGSNANRTTASASPAAPPVELAVSQTQPRTFKYDDLQYTVTKGSISTRVADDLPIDNSKPAVADITFSVVNNSKDGIAIRGGQWQLKLGDGSVYKRPYEDNLGPRDTKERRISFHVPASSRWEGAQISLDEPEKEPATLALDGAISPPQYPEKLALKSDAKTTNEPALSYVIQSADVDLDGFGHRAALGKRYLNLTVHISCKDGGNIFVPEFFHLLTNGTPSVPESSSDSDLSCPGAQDYAMSYVIPANAGAVELEVGKADIQKTATIPIDLRQ